MESQEALVIRRAFERHHAMREIPRPRPIEHGFESIDWTDAPLAKVHGIPGLDQNIPLHDYRT